MAGGHHLNASVVLAAVHGLLGLPGRCARSSLHSFAFTSFAADRKTVLKAPSQNVLLTERLCAEGTLTNRSADRKTVC